jgi:hypothetical protein
VPYDGRYTFVRIRYELPDFGGFGGGDIKWAHDYPRGERHFTKVMSTCPRSVAHDRQQHSTRRPAADQVPDCGATEPAWRPNDLEVVGMRNYIARAAPVFDDFAGEHWVRIRFIHKIKSIDLWHPYYRGSAVFWRVRGQRSKKRLAIANYNFGVRTLGYSDEGMFPVDASNEAYKIGVNYIIYALTR